MGPGRRTSWPLLEKRSRNVAVTPLSTGLSSGCFRVTHQLDVKGSLQPKPFLFWNTQAEVWSSVLTSAQSRPQQTEVLGFGEASVPGRSRLGALGLQGVDSPPSAMLGCLPSVCRPAAQPLRLRAFVEHLCIESTEWRCGRKGSV